MAVSAVDDQYVRVRGHSSAQVTPGQENGPKKGTDVAQVTPGQEKDQRKGT